MCFRLLKYHLDFKLNLHSRGEKSAEPAVGRPVDEQEVSEQNCRYPDSFSPGSRCPRSNESGLSYKV